ncbi:hypothetical protein B0H10DRAFT_590007 [Mycena sp. CBHHK59/15]|nr:hypothetical protein B0H10DRAFT_590007 [Mycena sp. CBHHK59/15]
MFLKRPSKQVPHRSRPNKAQCQWALRPRLSVPHRQNSSLSSASSLVPVSSSSSNARRLRQVSDSRPFSELYGCTTLHSATACGSSSGSRPPAHLWVIQHLQQARAESPCRIVLACVPGDAGYSCVACDNRTAPIVPKIRVARRVRTNGKCASRRWVSGHVEGKAPRNHPHRGGCATRMYPWSVRLWACRCDFQSRDRVGFHPSQRQRRRSVGL